MDFIPKPLPRLPPGQYPRAVANAALLHVITLLNYALTSSLLVNIDEVYIDLAPSLTHLFMAYAGYYHLGGNEVVTGFLLTLERLDIHLDEECTKFVYGGVSVLCHEMTRGACICWRMERGECVTFMDYLSRTRMTLTSMVKANRQRLTLKRKQFAPCPEFGQQQVSIVSQST